MSESVKRNFYYYDLITYGYDASTNSFNQIFNGPKLLYTIFDDIKKNQGVDGLRERNIVKTELGDEIFILVDKCEVDNPIEFRIVLCRKDALPYVEENGILRFLTDYLPKDFSLAEITHCVIYPDYYIMGAEYNYAGARSSALTEYLQKITKGLIMVSCLSKISNDAFSKIKDNKSYSLFTLSIKNNSLAFKDTLKNISIFSAIDSEMTSFDYVEVSFKRRKGKKKEGFEPPITKSEMEELILVYRDDLEKFEISQEAYKDKIDILNNKFVHRTKLLISANKTINSDDAYKEIRLFFEQTVVTECDKVDRKS